ncbi:MAG: MFS transporter [Pseudomonadota bacterium]
MAGERQGGTPILTLGLVIAGAVLGLAGTDLVLPAVPSLPEALGGNATQSQYVLATYVAGVGLGLLVFGALGGHFDQRWLLVFGVAGFGGVSLLATQAASMPALIALRFAQGVFAATAPVFAPGIIRALFDERGAIRAIGALGSIESLTPALAPIAGKALLEAGDWRLSFTVLAALSAIAAVGLLLIRHRIPQVEHKRDGPGYGALLVKLPYLRHVGAHAMTLGALLTFVFGAPAVIVNSMGGTLNDFIIMQVCGISTFIVAASGAEFFVSRFGGERIVLFGSALSTLGIIAISVYALAGGSEPLWLVPLFIPMNFGLGLRGPPGFYAAIVNADGDDARGSALLILAVMLATALGTAVAAPMIDAGLVPLALVSLAMSVLSPVLLMTLPTGKVLLQD